MDVSVTAGKRKGIHEGTRDGKGDEMLNIHYIQP